MTVWILEDRPGYIEGRIIGVYATEALAKDAMIREEMEILPSSKLVITAHDVVA